MSNLVAEKSQKIPAKLSGGYIDQFLELKLSLHSPSSDTLVATQKPFKAEMFVSRFSTLSLNSPKMGVLGATFVIILVLWRFTR